MPAFTASAPGKIILFGEHAVVYGQPAIAVPVTQVRATATVTPNIGGKSGDVKIIAPEIKLESNLAALPPGNPIGSAVNQVLTNLKVDRIPACTLKVTSTIPVAAGLGSGAAVSVAIIRSLAGFLGRQLPNETVSALAYEVEKIHHGTPSGIDNTVATYGKAVWFRRGGRKPWEFLSPTDGLSLVVGSSEVPSLTRKQVNKVARYRVANPAKFQTECREAEEVANDARTAMESGDLSGLGRLIDRSQGLLHTIGVSCKVLDEMVTVCRNHGALGAKLRGAGGGGCMLALAAGEPEGERLAAVLQKMGYPAFCVRAGAGP